jgi:hypothetical protein
MNRKELIRKYKETPRPMGVYVVRNTATGKSFIGSSVDVPARLNRLRTQLQSGLHPNRELQDDWKRLGADGFALETLDTLEPSDQPGNDPGEDLRVLEAMWREKLGELY